MTSIKHGTVALERVFAAPAGEVFAALSTVTALVEWGAPSDGWTFSYDRFDFRVGHTDIASFGPPDGEAYVNQTTYIAIDPGRRIVSLSTITHHDTLLFAGILTMELKAIGNDTMLRLTETGTYFDDSDGPQGHEAGWIEMLGGLGRWLKRNRQAA